jgi:ABC-type multidrug transport system ATPase subunit
MDDIVLQTFDLTKDYRGRRAVDHLNLEVRRGDVFGFLGPNGAGKSTTLRMLVGLVRPTAGRAELFGHCVQQEKHLALRRVGAVVETPAFYEFLSARENLCLFGRLSGPVPRPQVEAVLELVGLQDRADEKVRTFSHGLKQRLGLAQALLPQPELILLDEPTAGLDPPGMREVRDLLVDLARNQGVTVFLSSHLLNEVEQICNRVAIIHLGKLLIQGDIGELLHQGENSLEVTVLDLPRALEVLRAHPGVREVVPNGSKLYIQTQKEVSAADLNAFLVRRGVQVSGLQPHRWSLEEYFMEKVG